MKSLQLFPVLFGLSILSFNVIAADKECPPALAADSPIVPNSVEQVDINSGALSFEDINAHGEALFTAKFNTCDG